MASKIVFLHIPKTAGQSVHYYLTNIFGSDNVFPARVNAQFYQYSLKDLQEYQVFSGHFDWSLLSCLASEAFTFTILRNPVERIVSFYLYLRREAEKLSRNELNLPSNLGKKSILLLSPDEYFVNDGGIRKFVDDHYDNFYAYYFAGRAYDARTRIINSISDRLSMKTDIETRILSLALENMCFLQKVYSIDNWQKALSEDLWKMTGIKKTKTLAENMTWQTNVGDFKSLKPRLVSLYELGATKKTFSKIRDFVSLDIQIFNYYFEGNDSIDSMKTLEDFI